MTDAIQQDLDRMKRRLIRMVARLKQNKTQDLWEEVEKKLGNCRNMWYMMQMLCTKKLSRLLQAEDLPEKLPDGSRMKLTDWLLYDLVLCHETNICTITDAKEPSNPLRLLFELVLEHGAEDCEVDLRPEKWVEITVAYNTQGRQASPMLLQRRWYDLKKQTRDKFYQFWSIYKKKPKEDDAPSELHKDIATEFPDVVTKELPSWSELLNRGMVVEHDIMETAMRIIKRKSAVSEETEDVVLIEPEIETIDLDVQNEVEQSLTESELAEITKMPNAQIETSGAETVDRDGKSCYDTAAVLSKIDLDDIYDNSTKSCEVDREIDQTDQGIDLTDEQNKNHSDCNIITGRVTNLHTDIFIKEETELVHGEPDCIHQYTDDNSALNNLDSQNTVILTENTFAYEENAVNRPTIAPVILKVETLAPVNTKIYSNENSYVDVETVVNEDSESIITETANSSAEVESKPSLSTDESGANINHRKACPKSRRHLFSPKISKRAPNPISVNRPGPKSSKNSTYNEFENYVSTHEISSDEDEKPDFTFQEAKPEAKLSTENIAELDECSYEFADEDSDVFIDLATLKSIEEQHVKTFKVEKDEIPEKPNKNEEEDDPSQINYEDTVSDEHSNPKFDLKLLMIPAVVTLKLDDMDILNKCDITETLHDYEGRFDAVENLSRPVSEEYNINADSFKFSDQSRENDESARSEEYEEYIAEEPKILKDTSHLFQKPKKRVYTPLNLCKNPDFNTRLRRVSVLFLTSPRNRQLLKACKPLTVDLHKSFESQLVDGTLRITTTQKSENTTHNIDSQTTSVTPSVMPAQSLIDRESVNIGELIKFQPHESEFELIRARQKKSIQLLDRDKVRLVNQHLKTAQVTPMIKNYFNNAESLDSSNAMVVIPSQLEPVVEENSSEIQNCPNPTNVNPTASTPFSTYCSLKNLSLKDILNKPHVPPPTTSLKHSYSMHNINHTAHESSTLSKNKLSSKNFPEKVSVEDVFRLAAKGVNRKESTKTNVKESNKNESTAKAKKVQKKPWYLSKGAQPAAPWYARKQTYFENSLLTMDALQNMIKSLNERHPKNRDSPTKKQTKPPVPKDKIISCCLLKRHVILNKARIRKLTQITHPTIREAYSKVLKIHKCKDYESCHCCCKSKLIPRKTNAVDEQQCEVRQADQDKNLQSNEPPEPPINEESEIIRAVADIQTPEQISSPQKPSASVQSLVEVNFDKTPSSDDVISIDLTDDDASNVPSLINNLPCDNEEMSVRLDELLRLKNKKGRKKRQPELELLRIKKYIEKIENAKLVSGNAEIIDCRENQKSKIKDSSNNSSKRNKNNAKEGQTKKRVYRTKKRIQEMLSVSKRDASNNLNCSSNEYQIDQVTNSDDFQIIQVALSMCSNIFLANGDLLAFAEDGAQIMLNQTQTHLLKSILGVDSTVTIQNIDTVNELNIPSQIQPDPAMIVNESSGILNETSQILDVFDQSSQVTNKTGLVADISQVTEESFQASNETCSLNVQTCKVNEPSQTLQDHNHISEHIVAVKDTSNSEINHKPVKELTKTVSDDSMDSFIEKLYKKALTTWESFKTNSKVNFPLAEEKYTHDKNRDLTNQISQTHSDQSTNRITESNALSISTQLNNNQNSSEDTHATTSGCEENNPNEQSRETKTKKSILSDLMEISGISAEDTKTIQAEENEIIDITDDIPESGRRDTVSNLCEIVPFKNTELGMIYVTPNGEFYFNNALTQRLIPLTFLSSISDIALSMKTASPQKHIPNLSQCKIHYLSYDNAEIQQIMKKPSSDNGVGMRQLIVNPMQHRATPNEFIKINSKKYVKKTIVTYKTKGKVVLSLTNEPSEYNTDYDQTREKKSKKYANVKRFVIGPMKQSSENNVNIGDELEVSKGRKRRRKYKTKATQARPEYAAREYGENSNQGMIRSDTAHDEFDDTSDEETLASVALKKVKQMTQDKKIDNVPLKIKDIIHVENLIGNTEDAGEKYFNIRQEVIGNNILNREIAHETVDSGCLDKADELCENSELEYGMAAEESMDQEGDLILGI